MKISLFTKGPNAEDPNSIIEDDSKKAGEQQGGPRGSGHGRGLGSALSGVFRRIRDGGSHARGRVVQGMATVRRHVTGVVMGIGGYASHRGFGFPFMNRMFRSPGSHARGGPSNSRGGEASSPPRPPSPSGSRRSSTSSVSSTTSSSSSSSSSMLIGAPTDFRHLNEGTSSFTPETATPIPQGDPNLRGNNHWAGGPGLGEHPNLSVGEPPAPKTPENIDTNQGQTDGAGKGGKEKKGGLGQKLKSMLPGPFGGHKRHKPEVGLPYDVKHHGKTLGPSGWYDEGRWGSDIDDGGDLSFQEMNARFNPLPEVRGKRREDTGSGGDMPQSSSPEKDSDSSGSSPGSKPPLKPKPGNIPPPLPRSNPPSAPPPGFARGNDGGGGSEESIYDVPRRQPTTGGPGPNEPIYDVPRRQPTTDGTGSAEESIYDVLPPPRRKN